MDPIDASQLRQVDAPQEARARRDPRPDAPVAAIERRGERPESVDARAVTRATRSDTSPQTRRQSTSGEGDRDLVSISDEARQLLRSARERDPVDGSAREQAFLLARAAPSRANQLIAVRVGPTPLEDIPRPEAESRAAEALGERAFLRELGRVLSLPERTGADPSGQTGDDAENDARIRLLGAPRDGVDSRTGAGQPSATRERPAFARTEIEVARSTVGDIERSSSSARLFGSEPARAARREQEGLDRELGTPRGDPDLVRATSLAPQAGLARAPRGESERGPDNGAPVDSRGAPSLEATPQLTQDAVLEARSPTDIVTRFLSNLDSPDPGPEPRTRQVIGERV